MYAYMTCQLDIGYVVTILSKFLSTPSMYHYKLLKYLAQYLHLHATAHWEIRFKRTKPLQLSDAIMRKDFSITLSMMYQMNLKWKNYSMLIL